MESSVEPTLFSHPRGDLYLISSDEKIFQVSRTHLSFASEVFAVMFDIGSPENLKDGTSEHPLPIDATAALLDIILRLIYATGDAPIADHLELSLPCILFARKYALDFVLNSFRKAELSAVMERDPLQAYLIAAMMNWEREKLRMLPTTLELEDGPMRVLTGYKSEVELAPFRLELIGHHLEWQAKSRKAIVDFILGKPYLCGNDPQIKERWYGRKKCHCNAYSGLQVRLSFDPNEYMSNIPPPIWVTIFGERLLQITSSYTKIPRKVFDRELRETLLSLAPTCCRQEGLIMNNKPYVEHLYTQLQGETDGWRLVDGEYV